MPMEGNNPTLPLDDLLQAKGLSNSQIHEDFRAMLDALLKKHGPDYQIHKRLFGGSQYPGEDLLHLAAMIRMGLPPAPGYSNPSYNPMNRLGPFELQKALQGARKGGFPNG